MKDPKLGVGSTEGSGGKLISVPRQEEAGAVEARGIIFKREQSLVLSKSVSRAKTGSFGYSHYVWHDLCHCFDIFGKEKKDRGEFPSPFAAVLI